VPTKIPQAQIDQLAALYTSGLSLQKAAREVGVSWCTAQRHLSRAGLTRSTGGYHPRRLSEGQMAERYRRGESAEAIGRDAGVCAWTVLEHLRRCGVEVRNGVRKSRLMPAQMMALYRAGTSITDISRQAGIEPRGLRRHLTRRGVRLHACRAVTIRMPDDPLTLQRLADYLDCEGTIIVRLGPRAIYTRIEEAVRAIEFLRTRLGEVPTTAAER
jgi:lambda repressor-like predicted transcriptional regulator